MLYLLQDIPVNPLDLEHRPGRHTSRLLQQARRQSRNHPQSWAAYQPVESGRFEEILDSEPSESEFSEDEEELTTSPREADSDSENPPSPPTPSHDDDPHADTSDDSYDHREIISNLQENLFQQTNPGTHGKPSASLTISPITTHVLFSAFSQEDVEAAKTLLELKNKIRKRTIDEEHTVDNPRNKIEAKNAEWEVHRRRVKAVYDLGSNLLRVQKNLQHGKYLNIDEAEQDQSAAWITFVKACNEDASLSLESEAPSGIQENNALI